MLGFMESTVAMVMNFFPPGLRREGLAETTSARQFRTGDAGGFS
jgi:hypothetical protein